MENEVKVKKKFYKKWWFWVVAVVVFFIFVGAMSEDDSNDKSVVSNAKHEKTKTVEQSKKSIETLREKPKEKSWQKVIEFSGSSTKNTQTFKVNSNDWRINWSTEPGELGDMNFQIFVYNSNGSLNSLASNIIGKGNDTSYMKKSGEYYLTINTAQKYNIVIEENK